MHATQPVSVSTNSVLNHIVKVTQVNTTHSYWNMCQQPRLIEPQRRGNQTGAESGQNDAKLVQLKLSLKK